MSINSSSSPQSQPATGSQSGEQVHDLGKRPVSWPDAQRRLDCMQWLLSIADAQKIEPGSIRLASADASFRRYLRIDALDEHAQRCTRIIMDAPPQKENSQPFVEIAQLMESAGLRVPQILDWQAEKGFMLLSDLGTHTMMQVIKPDDPPPLDLYLQAVDTLIRWQLASKPGILPVYDRPTLVREMELYPQWYIGPHRAMVVDTDMRRTLDDAFSLIAGHNLKWPSVYVHRDFMPRNLMVGTPEADGTRGTLGVLDFQDAVYGPITYDIASLLRDAFLSWDEDFCLDVSARFWEKARKAGLPVGEDFGEFYRGVEWMGLQRHLKVAGIFARLTLRDGKPQYVADTPRFSTYIRATCERYRELKPLLRLVEKVDGISPQQLFAYGRP